MRKLLSLFLVGLLILLVSCENVEYPSGSSSEGESRDFLEQLESQLPTIDPSVEQEERDFVIFTDNTGAFMQDETAAASKNLAISERNSFLEMKYGANIIVEENTVEEIEYILTEALKKGTHPCDMICLSAEDTLALYKKGLLGNISALSNFNLENGFFDQDLAKNLATNNSLYMLADPCAYMYDSASVIYYNRNLVKAPEGGEDVETLALQGKWTWDTFYEYCKASAPGSFSSSGSNLKTDTFGYAFIAEPTEFAEAMWVSTNQQIVANTYKNPVEITLDREAVTPTADFLRSIYNVRGRYPLSGSDAREAFEEGRIAFYCDELGYLYSLRDGTSKGTEFGVLPMPKMNEEQAEYRCFLNNNAHVISVPKTLETADEKTKAYASAMISATCAAGSVTIKDAYLNTMLGMFLTTNNETVLIKTIVESASFDFAATFGSAISEIRTPTMKPVVNYIVDGLSLSTPGRQDFREYCDKNFQ